jgi:ATP-binding cassette, subfamily C, bacterial CydC
MLEGVGYAHDPATVVLEDATLHLDAGEHVALIGPSGCGKSTLAGLVARLEDPQAGRILTGGVPLAALDETTLRAHVVSLSQDAWIFTMTLAENLRMANPHANDAQLSEVLELVGLSDTVTRWPDGLATWIEEGGASLSGGQRRRLALARVLLRDAQIYVLDEPTEGLEVAAHAELLRRVREHLRGRTVLWITHLQAGLAGFDRIVRIESGAIKEADAPARSVDPSLRDD